jgi:hypothetical protein
VDLSQARCVPGRHDPESKIDRLDFVATFTADNLLNQQIIYQVVLEDARRRPIQSTDAGFRDARGRVAASKTLMVLESPWTFENTTLSIPLGQLEVHASDLPVTAVYSVCQADGACLASARTPVPLVRARRSPEERRPAVSPPRGEQVADAEPRRIVEEPAEKPPDRSEPPPPPPDEPPTQSSESLTRADEQADHPPERDEAASGLPERDEEPPAGSPEQDQARDVPTGAEPPRREPRIYVVQRGDTLIGIAKRRLGRSTRWRDLFELNRDRLDSPDQLIEGMKLRLPPEAYPEFSEP